MGRGCCIIITLAKRLVEKKEGKGRHCLLGLQYNLFWLCRGDGRRKKAIGQRIFFFFFC